MIRRLLAIVALAASLRISAQSPNLAAIAGSGEDEAAVARGGTAFAASCASCHGPAAKGTTPATDLIRSVRVRDDEKGELISPFLQNGHPETQRALPENTINDVVAWLHAQVYGVANRDTYAFLNILSGDAKRGEQFFNGPGKCNTCHSPKGDLAGIGERYDPPVLQSLWLNPRRGRGSANGTPTRAARTATVTPASGPPVSGTLEFLDEFNVVIRDAAGVSRSFVTDNGVPRVEIHDPLQAHFDFYPRLTDADMHNVTAWLATFK